MKILCVLIIIFLLLGGVTSAEIISLGDVSVTTDENSDWVYIETSNGINSKYIGFSKIDKGIIGIGEKNQGQTLDFIGHVWLISVYKQNSIWYLCPLKNLETITSLQRYSDGWSFTATDSSLTCYEHNNYANTVNVPMEVNVSMFITDEYKTKINVNTTLGVGSPTDTGFAFLFLPANAERYKYIEVEGTAFDLTGLEGQIPLGNRAFSFLDSEMKSIGHNYDWTDMLDTGSYYSEILTIGGSKGLLTGSYGYGASNTIIIDPIYYFDYTPIPALRWVSGVQTENDYNSFNSPATDVTSELSDNEEATGATIIKSSGGTTDNVIQSTFNVVYENGKQYWLRFFKGTNGDIDFSAYAHINETHINLSSKVTETFTGRGFRNLNITGLVSYMKLLGMNYTSFRFVNENTNSQKIEEFMMRVETNDTNPPNINNCSVSANNFSCSETINFTCTIIDYMDVAYAVFTIDSQDYLATGNGDEYTVSITETLIGTKNYAFTKAEGCDLFNQCDDINPSLNSLYTCVGNCTPDWVAQYENLSSCQNNNTIQKLLTYTDGNYCGVTTGLPLDNGSVSWDYCNYCTPDWQEITGGINECQSNSTRYVEYLDYNNCYSQTGLIEDAPPFDDDTWVSCNYFVSNFGCDISTDPYFKGKIDYTCILPYVNKEFQCLTIVTHGLDDVLQVNPQKQERSGSIFGFKTGVESREYFSTSLGLLNAYYTDKNIIPDVPFTITTRCTDGNSTLVHQVGVVPELEKLGYVPSYMVWLRENWGFLFAGFLSLMIVSLLLFYWIKEFRRAK